MAEELEGISSILTFQILKQKISLLTLSLDLLNKLSKTTNPLLKFWYISFSQSNLGLLEELHGLEMHEIQVK